MIFDAARHTACCFLVGGMAALFASTGGAAAPAADARAQAESTHAPTVALWHAKTEYAGVVYFLFDAPARIERYDTAQAAWLPVIPLDAAAAAFDVDASGIYVSAPAGVLHFGLDGTSTGLLPGVPGAQAFLALGGTFLLTGIDQDVASYDKSTGAPIDSVMAFGPMLGYSAAPAEGRLFALSWGGVMTIPFDPQSGAFGDEIENNLINMPVVYTTYTRPEGGLVIDTAGTTYASTDLHYLGSLGGEIQGIAFLPDGFAVMQGTSLTRFSYDLRSLGVAEPPAALADIVAAGGVLYAIRSTGGSLALSPIPSSAFHAPAPPPARAWTETAGHADTILGDAGALLLTNLTEHAVYPFHAENWTYGNPVPLFVAPVATAYSPENASVYASYDGGAIYGFPIDEPGTAEYVASTIVTPGGLATAGAFVFAEDGSGAWCSHYTFAPTGPLLTRADWNYVSRQYEWDPVRRKMYFFRDDTSPNDLQWEEIGLDGTIIDAGETPYHGEVMAQTPIRVAPDGAKIVIGSGQVFDAGTLLFAGDLGLGVADVAWSSSGNLYGIGSDAPSRFLRFSPAYQVIGSGAVRGVPRRLLRNGSNFLYLADVGATTIVGVLDPFLAKADLAVDPVALGGPFGSGSSLSFDITIGNNGSVPAFGATVSGDLSGLDNPTWECVADTVGVAGCDGVVNASSAVSGVLDLADGAQAHYHVTGSVPADVINKVAVPFEIDPADPASDPELRNNAARVRVRVDELFRGTFDPD